VAYCCAMWSGRRSVRPELVDAATVVLAALVGTLLTVGPTAVFVAHMGAGTVVALGFAGSLWWRRQAPGRVAALAVAGSGALILAEAVAPGTVLRSSASPDMTVLLVPTAPFAAYAVAAYAGNRRSAWLPVVALLAMASAPWQPSVVRARQGLILIGVPVLLGLYLAARRRLVAALLDRALRAERERRLVAEHAVAEERARLTAEMHDVVTHRVSMIVLEAGALGLTTTDETTAAAAERMRTLGCRALDELRTLVRVLPDQPEPAQDTEPVPDLGMLADDARAAGTPVDLLSEGQPVPVVPIIGLVVYRIVQEGLTNTRKHAPGARAKVRISYDTEGIGVLVRNDPAAAPVDSALAATGSGTGLTGLRQRVELVGGTLYASPRGGGGFDLYARLPTHLPARPSDISRGPATR